MTKWTIHFYLCCCIVMSQRFYNQDNVEKHRQLLKMDESWLQMQSIQFLLPALRINVPKKVPSINCKYYSKL